MTHAPLVSVVIPTHNRLDLLRESIRSVLDQTLGDFEVVVADDASEADVEGLVRSFNDPRLRVHRARQNVGQALNVRAGLAAAQGKYVSLLHDDDLLEPTALERLVEPLERDPEVVLAFADHWMMDGEGRLLHAETDAVFRRYRAGVTPGKHGPFQRLALVDLGIHFALGTTYRREALGLGDFPAEVGDYCDRWLGYLACRSGGAAFFVPERLSRYRQHGSQISHRRGVAHARSGMACYRRLLADPRLQDVHPELARDARFYRYALGMELLWSGEAALAWPQLLRGLPFSPLKAGAGLLLNLLPRRALTRLEPVLR